MSIVDLDARRFERLVAMLTELLQTKQGANVPIERVGDVAQFRKAARAAGRRLNVPVRTGLSRDGKTVWFTEGP